MLDRNEIISFSSNTIREVFGGAGLPVTGIFLFGSRARDDFNPGSDWDFLVCTKNDVPFAIKAKLTGTIQTLLAERGVSADIIVKSEHKLEEERENVGVITYYALKEGLPV